MKVLIVDDSAFMRRAIEEMLKNDPQIEIVGKAKNGVEGLEMANRLKPDVITLDIEMPEMDGLTTLRRIMRECPTQVIMLSSLTTEGSHVALQAMKLGAGDVLAKDMSQVSLSVTNIQEDLITRVRALGQTKPTVVNQSTKLLNDDKANRPPVFRSGQFDVVCIGSSTGGPPVLETILTSLPDSFTIPIVVAQHMPEVFTRSMTERLDHDCQMRVIHAEDGMPVEPRTIYIAPGGKHTHIKKTAIARRKLLVNHEPSDALYKPSVDALFHSAAESTGSRTLAVVLTGIGNDGLDGGRAIHACKGTILAQNQESCVVYGMPKAVTENALTVASLDPDQIATCLQTLSSSRGPNVAKAS